MCDCVSARAAAGVGLKRGEASVFGRQQKTDDGERGRGGALGWYLRGLPVQIEFSNRV